MSNPDPESTGERKLAPRLRRKWQQAYEQAVAAGSPPQEAAQTADAAVAQGGAGKALREILETVILAVVLALLIRGFVAETFVVQGISMRPTLHTGERVVVAKFLDWFGYPHDGQIVVFRYPKDPAVSFIKRVIATPGQTVQIKGGHVYVDGRRLVEPFIKHQDSPTDSCTIRGYNCGPVTVPPGDLYVLGDNRPNSEDSRYFGFVPLANLQGPAVLVFWPPQDFRLVH